MRKEFVKLSKLETVKDLEPEGLFFALLMSFLWSCTFGLP